MTYKTKKFGKDDSIIIRSWPKVIFLYPVMVTAFFCGLWQVFTAPPADAAVEQGAVIANEAAGMIFVLVLCLNLLVISFDFNRFKTMAIVFFCMAVVFLLLYLSNYIEVLAWLKSLLGGLHFQISTSVYLCIGFYFLLVFTFVWITTRFNYWVIKSNEILHKEGFLGDVRRYPSPNLKLSKEINDVFEFLLLGAGRVVINPASEKKEIVLQHVLRVNAAERAIQDLLSSLAVEVHTRDSGHDHDDDHEFAG